MVFGIAAQKAMRESRGATDPDAVGMAFKRQGLKWENANVGVFLQNG